MKILLWALLKFWFILSAAWYQLLLLLLYNNNIYIGHQQMERGHIPILPVCGRLQTFPPEQLQTAASSRLHFVSLLIRLFTCLSIGTCHSRTEDVEAAGASMMAQPPSYDQLYHHRGRQDPLDHDDSDAGSQSSLGEPPPYKSGMIYHLFFKWRGRRVSCFGFALSFGCPNLSPRFVSDDDDGI